MITPIEIEKKASNKYLEYLRSLINGVEFQPIIIKGDKKPNADTVLLEKELTELDNRSKEKNGYGYTIEYQTIKTKNHGLQDLPISISFQTEQDYLKYIKKEKETINFKANFTKILESFPELKDWMYKSPLKVIENEWDSLLKVCVFFKSNPKPNLFIRELPIKVHTKFVETNKGIIKELLEIIIADYVNADEKDFEPRFNLKSDVTIRFRVLDSTISHKYFSGIDDLSIPSSQFKNLNLPIKNVYIVENKKNLLTFPSISESIVIWGEGFGAKIMKDVEWLSTKKIFYWGDIDAQGFEILSQVRSYYPSAQSFLMDWDTFNQFNEKDRGTESKVTTTLNLTKEEYELYNYLKSNNLRLEQEKISHEYELSKIPL
ncbi:MAG: hypothetical protein J6U21_05095 [Bacteroidales bacterium]|nr:hypothetical protein [Bacteroidales bacterium]